MTIKADWIKILKRANGDAFTTRIPSRPYVAFIDGQIKLMCGAHVASWLQFFTAQFVSTIDQGFAAGAEVVVLGFDDYAFVPSAKNMTQIKRIKFVPSVEFGEHEELPQEFPDNWMDSIKNRAFKAKVITFVVCNVRRHYARETARTVVIDWRGPPEVIGRGITLPAMFAGEAAAAEAAARAAAKAAWEAKAEKRAAKAAAKAAKAAKAAARAAAPATDCIDLTAGTESAGPTLNELNMARQVHPNLRAAPALHWIQEARRAADAAPELDCVLEARPALVQGARLAAIQGAQPAAGAASAPLRRGECDTKAFSWLELGPMLLISTDGDYIPIALAQIETQGTTHEVYLHRMVCRSDGPGKRKPDGRPKREYEYVDLNKLLSFVRAEFPQSKTPARTFAAMVSLLSVSPALSRARGACLHSNPAGALTHSPAPGRSHGVRLHSKPAGREPEQTMGAALARAQDRRGRRRRHASVRRPCLQRHVREKNKNDDARAPGGAFRSGRRASLRRAQHIHEELHRHCGSNAGRVFYAREDARTRP